LRNIGNSVILIHVKRSANVVQLSPRGQITLPGPVRKALGLEPGDNLVVSVEGERAVIEPAVVVPIERYTAERTREFEEAGRMSPDEIRKARRKWRL
jgi:AbrB family looped-hinge helix DNA binding protein